MTIRLLTGDCREVLATLPDASVHMVVTSPPYYGLRSYLNAEHPDKAHEMGSEATPDAYIAAMVGVFRQLRRVLRDDGTCWVNMGDSYASSGKSGLNEGFTERDTHGHAHGPNARSMDNVRNNAAKRVPVGLKPKDLLMMPARLALALQADGWWVRSDIIWAKPNPMPESCTDRPTSAHEHVFLLTKRARYFYDADAVREEAESFGRQHTTGIQPPKVIALQENGTHGKGGDLSINYERSSRNLRNVWTIATHAYPAAHFATFAPELAARCIRAGTSERGCCAACGAPHARQTSVSYTDAGNGNNNMKRKGGGDYEAAMSARPYEVRKLKDVETLGWSASCQCEAATVPCTVLDPFSGAGTALLVADRLGRDAVGIDLSHAYVDMTRERLTADCPLFMDIGPSPPPAEDPEDERMADLFQDMAAD